MNSYEHIPTLRTAATASIPRINADGPLFPLAWHARAFALIVAMVEGGKLDWNRFQPRLVAHLSDHEDESLSGDEITGHYFEHWLEAAEDILVAQGFLILEEIPEQIHRIRETVDTIRAEQKAGC